MKEAMSIDDIVKSTIAMCDERINRLMIAIPINKHSKRKKKMEQLLNIFIGFRVEQVEFLKVIEDIGNQMSEVQCNS